MAEVKKHPGVILGILTGVIGLAGFLLRAF